MDNTFHFPPELFKLLVDTIPKLCRAKSDLLLFFRGAGVSPTILRPYENLLRTSKDSFNKYTVTQELLARLNVLGDVAIRQRREIIKRVVEFENFSVCWDSDRAAAIGLVAQIRDVVNVKDSFTRMRMEKDIERRKRIEQQEAAAAVLRERQARIEGVKSALFALFPDQDAHKRGKALENVLNDLFACFDISVREAFTVKGFGNEGVIEQIDGLVELDGHIYLVEMKWWNRPIGVAEIAQPLVRLVGRGGHARGIFISYSDFTDAAVSECRNVFAAGALIILATLQEIVDLLNRQGDFRDWLKRKVDITIADKNPYTVIDS